MQLRIAAGKPAGAAVVGRRFVRDWGERLDLGPSRPPAGQDVRIDERERRIGCERDALRRRGQLRQRGTLRRPRRRLRKRHDAIEVERALGDVGEPVETVFQIGGLPGLHESKVPFRQREAGIAGDRAEQGQTDPIKAVLHEAAVPLARHLVQHDAGDPDARIEAGAAERHGGGGLGLPGRVEHEEHGPAEAGGDVGAGAGASGLPRTPSNKPIEPSATIRSASRDAASASAARRSSDMAKVSRLRLGAPVAAAWKAGSM